MTAHAWDAIIAAACTAAMVVYRIWFPRRATVDRTARALWILGHGAALAGALVILHAVLCGGPHA